MADNKNNTTFRTTIGGQALIEGILMRGPEKQAIVCRKADGTLEGTAAVIDKDLASEKLAEDIDADVLLILTAVESVSINFRKPDQKDLDKVTVAEVKEYMARAGVTEGDSKLSMKFTIAGANLTDHPTYATFRQAADLLNECGWNIEVVPDTQALTKINTGSLAVWAAAWGSALDPDMYQVYHKDSTATSTQAWGYPYLKTNGTFEETDILNSLADLIDAARSTNDQDERADLYEQAMGYILDLAIELPVYQRDVLYAFNGNVLNTDTMPTQDELNPFSSPLDRIWEVEFAG